MNHTPGPWFAVEYSGYWDIQREDEYSVDNLLNEDCYPDAEANAKLMAAAPENTQSNIYMTGAVQRCIEVLKEHVLPDSKLSDTDALLKIYAILDTPEMVDKLKISNAAIKKATL